MSRAREAASAATRWAVGVLILATVLVVLQIVTFALGTIIVVVAVMRTSIELAGYDFYVDHH